MHDKTLDNFDQPRITPYDTGKIKIGVYYEPPRPAQDEDEIALQDALLGGKWRPAATVKTNWQMVALALGGIIIYILGVSLMLR